MLLPPPPSLSMLFTLKIPERHSFAVRMFFYRPIFLWLNFAYGFPKFLRAKKEMSFAVKCVRGFHFFPGLAHSTERMEYVCQIEIEMYDAGDVAVTAVREKVDNYNDSVQIHVFKMYEKKNKPPERGQNSKTDVNLWRIKDNRTARVPSSCDAENATQSRRGSSLDRENTHTHVTLKFWHVLDSSHTRNHKCPPNKRKKMVFGSHKIEFGSWHWRCFHTARRSRFIHFSNRTVNLLFSHHACIRNFIICFGFWQNVHCGDVVSSRFGWHSKRSRKGPFDLEPTGVASQNHWNGWIRALASQEASLFSPENAIFVRIFQLPSTKNESVTQHTCERN